MTERLRADLAGAAFGKINAVYGQILKSNILLVDCLNHVCFDDKGSHVIVSIEHFLGRALHLETREECFQKQSPP